MVRRLGAICRLAVAILAVSGCGDEPTGSPHRLPSVPSVKTLRGPQKEAALVVAQAVQGGGLRGEQDEWLRIEAGLPGFGGFFIDSLDEVHVYMKDQSLGAPERARAAVVAAYANRPAHVQRAVRNAQRAIIEQGRFSIGELVAMENRIVWRTRGIEGLLGAGVSPPNNKVYVKFNSEQSKAAGIAELTELDVPPEAIDAVVGPRMITAGTWLSPWRANRGGGVQFTVGRTTERCSLGFNFDAGSLLITYFMTAAHCFNGKFTTNGRTGDSVFQAIPSHGAVGDLTINPAWDTGTACPLDGTTHPDFCGQDVAVGYNYWNSGASKTVGTSTWEGENNSPGAQDINGFYDIANWVNPELIPMSRNKVHKSGRTTGTTTGQLLVPCVSEAAEIFWPDQYHKKLITVICAAVVANASIGYGDSGGPVFARLENGGPYYALGIVHAGTLANSSGDGWCTYGCQYLFSRWNKIQERFGPILGTLNP